MKVPKKITSVTGGARWVCPKCGRSHDADWKALACCNAVLRLPGGGAAPAVAAQTPGTKATNPKDAAAFDKAPLHLVPASFKAYTAMALAEGAMKYGSWNWRAAGVRASVYVSALQRHLDKWFNGEEFDPETGVPHLANACACLAVLIDGKTQQNMTDDRPPRQYSLPGLVNEETPRVIAKLREVFGDRNPKHFSINDDGTGDDL